MARTRAWEYLVVVGVCAGAGWGLTAWVARPVRGAVRTPVIMGLAVSDTSARAAWERVSRQVYLERPGLTVERMMRDELSGLAPRGLELKHYIAVAARGR